MQHAKVLKFEYSKLLSRREVQTLQLASFGMSTAQIAGHMHCSNYTVSDHRKSILRKLRVHNMPHAVRVGLVEGII